MSLKDSLRSALGLREPYPGAVEWPGRCPSPDHQDSTPSASFNVVKGKWVCYSCHRGGDIADLIGGYLPDPSAQDMLSDITATLKRLDSQVRVYPESWARMFMQPTLHPYWVSRGFDDVDASAWCLGYDFESGRVVYPMRDHQGRVLGMVKRTIHDDEPKYLYPPGVTKSHHLFGYDVAMELTTPASTVALVEGAIDVMAFAKAGVVALGCYGSSLSETQERLIRRLAPQRLVVCGDLDRAGQRLTQSVVYGSSLADHMDVVAGRWPHEWGKDIAEMTFDQRRAVVGLT